MFNDNQESIYRISVKHANQFTCSNLSEHLENVSHDTVTDFLQNSKFTPRDLWDLVKDRIDDSEEAFLLVDDSVQNKQYSQAIETVKLQYSGNEHGLVKGIGLVNLVHTNGSLGNFYPINYRIYNPDSDGKTKNEHFQEMFKQAVEKQEIKARKIAFDSWYASVGNLKMIHRSGWTFYTRPKKQSQSKYHQRNRLSGFSRTPMESGRIDPKHFDR
jgi:hypothetical protein